MSDDDIFLHQNNQRDPYGAPPTRFRDTPWWFQLWAWSCIGAVALACAVLLFAPR